MTYLRLFSFSLAVIAFGSFGWAAACFFRLPDRESRKARGMASVLVWPSIFIETIGILLFANSRGLISLSILLFTVSLVVFWASVYFSKDHPPSFAFSRETPTRLLRSGIYKSIRHPIYTAYSLAWLAGPVATAKWWMFTIFLVMAMIYYKAARLEEMSFRDSSFGREYEQYRTVAGMFFPKLPRLLRTAGKFQCSGRET
jgi:protein-S-isoprenylcysteine O-methyltransferase Ste14